MIPKDSDSSPEGDWDDPEDLGWNEFEWEAYLRSQDEVVMRYQGCYLKAFDRDDRLDHVARQMGWDAPPEEGFEPPSLESEDSDEDDEDESEGDPYTLQRNPVYIASTALLQLLTGDWERMVRENPGFPANIALTFPAALTRSDRNTVLGLQCLDLGDYTLAISSFKRALRDLNAAMAVYGGVAFQPEAPLCSHRELAMPRLFDLREVLLRVIRECRDEITREPRPSDEDEGEKRS